MSLEAIELMSEKDRQEYADFLARELVKPPITPLQRIRNKR